ncbi:c-type cytochrome [Thiohalomonas denitrificans]|uniref:Cytochrome c553 n=1 Tax=Thiohalomonas denitrificans TaxID=415747 RepID=A0A1G5QJT9_9GAMM|nr:c-type cytochrome [Thiohalomonas denitrificans]SCZ61820.1 Cytochrome c553 [Thiohalomonas denitrificans]
MTKTIRTIISMGLATGLCFSASANAQDEAHLQERERLLSLIEAVNGDPDKRKRAIQKGHQRVSFCSNCHGDDGNSKRPEIPNLAGQNPAYLLEQFDLFADGRRKDFVMQTLAREFTLEDKVNISIYFANQEVVRDQEIDPFKARQGKEIFESVCQYCHGKDGKGEAGYARLAGQQKDFMINALKRYRENTDTERAPDEVRRTDARMERVTQHLTDQDIEALANYIASIE